MSNNFHHYEIVINEKDYHVTYCKSDDKITLREFPKGYDGEIRKLPKIFEKEGFEEWAIEENLLRESMLTFSPEEDTWIDREWDIPFSAFINEYEKMVEALVDFVQEFCEIEL